MKKIVVLTLLIIFLLSSICFAGNVDLDKWEWVVGNGRINYYHDKQSIQYLNDGNECSVHILRMNYEEENRSIAQFLIKKNKTITFLSLSVCDFETGYVINSFTPEQEYVSIEKRPLYEILYDTFFPKRKYDPLLYIEDEG